MTGTRKLKLAFPVQLHGDPEGYEIIEVTNSIEFTPGQKLVKDEVSSLLAKYVIVIVRKK